jgi:hypothetical protein
MSSTVSHTWAQGLAPAFSIKGSVQRVAQVTHAKENWEATKQQSKEFGNFAEIYGSEMKKVINQCGLENIETGAMPFAAVLETLPINFLAIYYRLGQTSLKAVLSNPKALKTLLLSVEKNWGYKTGREVIPYTGKTIVELGASSDDENTSWYETLPAAALGGAISSIADLPVMLIDKVYDGKLDKNFRLTNSAYSTTKLLIKLSGAQHVKCEESKAHFLAVLKQHGLSLPQSVNSIISQKRLPHVDDSRRSVKEVSSATRSVAANSTSKVSRQ